jgi:hypothetical protein
MYLCSFFVRSSCLRKVACSAPAVHVAKMLLRLNVLLLWRRRNWIQEGSAIPLQHEMGSQGVLMVVTAIRGWASIFNGTHNIRGLGSDSCVGKACLDDGPRVKNVGFAIIKLVSSR